MNVPKKSNKRQLRMLDATKPIRRDWEASTVLSAGQQMMEFFLSIRSIQPITDVFNRS
jgi:hypothetical protein